MVAVGVLVGVFVGMSVLVGVGVGNVSEANNWKASILFVPSAQALPAK